MAEDKNEKELQREQKTGFIPGGPGGAVSCSIGFIQEAYPRQFSLGRGRQFTLEIYVRGRTREGKYKPA